MLDRLSPLAHFNDDPCQPRAQQEHCRRLGNLRSRSDGESARVSATDSSSSKNCLLDLKRSLTGNLSCKGPIQVLDPADGSRAIPLTFNEIEVPDAVSVSINAFEPVGEHD